MWTLVLQALLPALGWFTPWCRGSLRLLDGEVTFIFLGDDNLGYLLLVRLKKMLILMALSLAMMLIFQDLPFASWHLGGHTIIVRWTWYIWLRKCPAVTPQALIHLEGCRLSGYFWLLELMNAALFPSFAIKVVQNDWDFSILVILHLSQCFPYQNGPNRGDVRVGAMSSTLLVWKSRP